MSRIGCRVTAPDGSSFSPGAFDGNVGKKVSVAVFDIPIGDGILISATVADDGKSVWLVCEMPEPAPVIDIRHEVGEPTQRR